MFEIFKEINWTLICTLIVVSAVVSWAGDAVGMRLGKKRITIFRLRPKYTSRLISVITGIGIALVTLLVVSFASETVRTALFSMNFMQNQITSLTEELQKNKDSLQGMSMQLFENKGELQEKQSALSDVEKKLGDASKSLSSTKKQLADMKALKDKTESESQELIKEKLRLEGEAAKLNANVSQLNAEAKQLKAGIQRLREGRVAAMAGEMLAQSVIQPNKLDSSAAVDHFLSSLSEEARALLAYRFGKKGSEVQAPQISAESAETVKKEIARSPSRWVVRMTALSNAVEGEPVMAKVAAVRTRQIYKAKEVLSEVKFAAGMSKDKVEDQVFRALKEVNASAARDGVLRDPLTGNLGSIDTGEFMDSIEKIAESKKETTLQITAAGDIYTEGPVRVKFNLK